MYVYARRFSLKRCTTHDYTAKNTRINATIIYIYDTRRTLFFHNNAHHAIRIVIIKPLSVDYYNVMRA